LQAGAPSRIVNVASVAERNNPIDFEDLQGVKSYSEIRSYNQSKLANLLFTYELAARLERGNQSVERFDGVRVVDADDVIADIARGGNGECRLAMRAHRRHPAGELVVVQNVFTSLFNSHLFDFGQGWLYVFGVGIVGGSVLRDAQGPPAVPPAASPVAKP